MESSTIKRIDMKEYIRPYSLKFIFAWYDLWVGLFIDRDNKLIYFFPVPMFGVRFKFGHLKYQSK